MERVGIICEFNPFHNGHKRLIDSVRAAGGSEIVCLMSGCFVQRCEPAVLPAFYRAEAAIGCGADAVFELPFPYSCASAQFFAGAGTDILSRLGCDTLAFGSESGDLKYLCEMAEKPAYKTPVDRGSAECFERLSPNDILGTEYIRAVRRQNLSMDFFTVRREGSGYKDEEISDIPSATALRLAMREGRALSGVPECSYNAIEKAVSDCCAPADFDGIGNALLAFWRLCDAEAVSVYAECGGGVAGLLHDCAGRAKSFEEMMKLSSTKRYTDARLRRAALFGLLCVTEEKLKRKAAYARLIAASQTGREMLGKNAASFGIDVVTKVSQIPKTDEAREQKKAELASEALYTLCLPKALEAGSIFKKSAVFF